MKKYLIAGLFSGFLFFAGQIQAQTVDSAAIMKSQKRIEGNLNDAEKMQRKIDKRQRRIEKQQKRIGRQERKRERKMRKVENDQNRINDATTQ